MPYKLVASTCQLGLTAKRHALESKRSHKIIVEHKVSRLFRSRHAALMLIDVNSLLLVSQSCHVLGVNQKEDERYDRE